MLGIALGLSEPVTRAYLMLSLAEVLLKSSVYITSRPLQWLVRHTSGPVGELAFRLLLQEGVLRMRLLAWYLLTSTRYLQSQLAAMKQETTVKPTGVDGEYKDSTP